MFPTHRYLVGTILPETDREETDREILRQRESSDYDYEQITNERDREKLAQSSLRINVSVHRP